MIVELLVAGAFSCPRHPGPWPLPAPAAHRCATVTPNPLAGACRGEGVRIVCPSAAVLLEAIVERRARK